MASDSRVTDPDDARTQEPDGKDPNTQNPSTQGAEGKAPNTQTPNTQGAEGQGGAGDPQRGTKKVRKDKKPAKKPVAATGAAAAAGAAKAANGETKPPVVEEPKIETNGKEQPKTEKADSKDTDPAAKNQEEADSESSSLLATLAENRFILLNAVPSWMVSMVIHAIMLMILALLTLPERPPEQRIVAVANPNDVEEIENLDSEQIDALDVDVFEGAAPDDRIDERETTADLEVPSFDDVTAAPETIKLEGFGEFSALPEGLMDRIGGGSGTGLGDARGASGRRGAVEKFGGSKGSEAAVAAALKWIAEHQMKDGGWHFDHTMSACQGRCTHAGDLPPSRNGATALALLPFLGAGQTHKEGKYKETVERGLSFLIRSMKLTNKMGALSDPGGKLYSHGLASIVLCEAYAMTNDPALLQPAQLSLNFIVYAQDTIGGGWRYRPGQAGDTSVLGWQLMACKSGHMAYLKVPRKTILGASRFLDFVQDENGAKYGYTVPAQGPATTAVGLLCRMYLGWKHDNASLKAGVEYLHKQGPTENIYYNYYATQVMRHYGGQFWEDWNSRMRDRMVNSQEKKGHAAGSWYFQRSPHARKGGRLYCTAMATMILEVYYRHMPIYGKQAAEEEFPL